MHKRLGVLIWSLLESIRVLFGMGQYLRVTWNLEEQPESGTLEVCGGI